MPRFETGATLLIAISCGVTACSDDAGGSAGGPGPATNVVPLVVNAGPAGPAEGYVNGLFASATLCVAGDAAHCQTIDGLLVDTGSVGVRVLSSAVQLPFARIESDDGNDLANCVQFVDGSFFFGPIAMADVTMGGELASNVPIQLIAAPGSSEFPPPPDGCTSGGGVNQGTLAGLGANGVLGIGLFPQDCGAACVTDSTSNFYFQCTTDGCQPALAPLEKQLANPVAAFAADNNGVVIALPPVATDGTVTVTGALTFGIGTQKNNALGAAAILKSDSSGSMTTQFQGQSYGESAIDSGTNAIYFLDAKTAGFPTCKTNTDFYCPVAPTQLSVSLLGDDGRSTPLTLPMGNADSLLAKDAYAFDNLAGPNTPNVGFLLGIPFFYGKNVYSAIDGRDTPGGTGPYWAY